MKRSGYADLPLHYGQVPPWLAERMTKLGGAIIESIVMEYGQSEVLRRISDPFWFQALGCVMGMDWHSSGITTSVMGALKKAINLRAKDLGLYVCGGRGKHSRKTPEELLKISEKTGLNGNDLIRSSRLSAKIDNTAIQDGFQLYLHSFLLSSSGEWSVIQQGMNNNSGMARRYHWHSTKIKSFIEEPHSFIYGQNQGKILNMVHKEAKQTHCGVLELVKEGPVRMLPEIKKLVMPKNHQVTARDVNLKRLGSILALAQESDCKNFETLLLLEGLGPRTLQSLVLVSEVIHGTPSRFSDPARFSFAHGGKDGHPFPVPLKIYDETILHLDHAIQKAKIGSNEKQKAIKSLHKVAIEIENEFKPSRNLQEVIHKENEDSYKYGGRTVKGFSRHPSKNPSNNKGQQLELF